MTQTDLQPATKGLIYKLELQTGVVSLGRAERWCATCGESMLSGEACPRCAGRDGIDPRQVLQSDEYSTV